MPSSVKAGTVQSKPSEMRRNIRDPPKKMSTGAKVDAGLTAGERQKYLHQVPISHPARFVCHASVHQNQQTLEQIVRQAVLAHTVKIRHKHRIGSKVFDKINNLPIAIDTWSAVLDVVNAVPNWWEEYDIYHFRLPRTEPADTVLRRNTINSVP